MNKLFALISILIFCPVQGLKAQKTDCNLPLETGLNCFIECCCCEDQCEGTPQCDVCGTWSSANPTFTNCSPGDWELMFYDEFDGISVDQNKWTLQDWGNSYMAVQSSMEYLSPDGSNHQVSYNSQIGSGTLKITAKQETVTARVIPYCPDQCVPNCSPQEIDTCILQDGLPNKRTFYYTSGALYSNTQQLGLFSAGKYEIRCKIPKVDGLWPSFWLYGACAQEIDIFEFTNDDVNEDATIASSRQRMTYHTRVACDDALNLTQCQAGESPIAAIDYSQDWHVFSVVWDAYQITWYVDGIPKRKIKGLIDSQSHAVDECDIPSGGPYQWNSLMPTHPMDIRVGLGVIDFCEDPAHPEFTYGSLPTQSCARGTYPATYEIDYIRAWKRVPAPPDPIYTCTPFHANDKVINDNHIHGTHTLHILNSITNDPSVTIESDANVWWTAGDYLEFTNGFTVEAGADFTAEIADCQHGFLRTMNDSTKGPKSYIGETAQLQHTSKEQAVVNSATANSFLSPNPSSGIFKITSDELQITNVEIYNTLGEKVFQSEIHNSQSEIDLSSHHKGIYFIKVISEENIYTEKIVIQ